MRGPLTELDPSPADLSAPATRGDIVRVLEALRAMETAAAKIDVENGHGVSVARVDALSRIVSLADEIKEERA